MTIGSLLPWGGRDITGVYACREVRLRKKEGRLNVEFSWHDYTRITPAIVQNHIQSVSITSFPAHQGKIRPNMATARIAPRITRKLADMLLLPLLSPVLSPEDQDGYRTN